jgi:FixJ family two-component response regulator
MAHHALSSAAAAVAIVDDDDSVLRALRRLLSAAGFEARAFHSGREFLDALADDGFGCVLLDIRMPELDGFAVARKIAGRIPFVFLTAHCSDANRREAERQGAAGFLRKPATEKIILAAIRMALGPAGSDESATN